MHLKSEEEEEEEAGETKGGAGGVRGVCVCVYVGGWVGGCTRVSRGGGGQVLLLSHGSSSC
jgi:hypothetical protein